MLDCSIMNDVSVGCVQRVIPRLEFDTKKDDMIQTMEYLAQLPGRCWMTVSDSDPRGVLVDFFFESAEDTEFHERVLGYDRSH